MKEQISVNFDKELLEKITQYGKKMNVGRTAAISILCTTALQEDSIMDILPELLKASKKK